MTEHIKKILEIIKPEEGRGRSALGNMLLSLPESEQQKVLMAVADYQDRFKKANPDYRAMCAYLITGVIRDLKEGDNVADRIEIECFGEHIAHDPSNRSFKREISHERVYEGNSPHPEQDSDPRADEESDDPNFRNLKYP